MSTTNGASLNGTRRTPVYFVSHGGPNTMYETDHPVYPRLQGLGLEITKKVKPKAIVVVSAHWQSDIPGSHTNGDAGKGRKAVVEINTSESEPLLYDFYGFPRHYYSQKFPNRGSKAIADRVRRVVSSYVPSEGDEDVRFEVSGTERGLDHGVFVPFKIMFDANANPLGDIPIVQVSLLEEGEYGDDAGSHIALGRALEPLRNEGVVIIASGMAVHNLRHLMGLMRAKAAGKEMSAMEYAVTFDEGLRMAVEGESGRERNERMTRLLKREDARLAHPTFEHLLPVHVAVGAAGEDKGRRLWTLAEGSFSWAQYRFGEV